MYSKVLFMEMTSLQKTLESLTDHRVALRKDYVDRDRQLGVQMKDIMVRMEKLGELIKDNPAPESVESEVAATSEMQVAQLENAELINKAKEELAHTTLTMESVGTVKTATMKQLVPLIIKYFETTTAEIKSVDIANYIKKEYGLHIANITQTMNKVLTTDSRIKKIERGLYAMSEEYLNTKI